MGEPIDRIKTIVLDLSYIKFIYLQNGILLIKNLLTIKKTGAEFVHTPVNGKI
jgi:hypothetical protein